MVRFVRVRLKTNALRPIHTLPARPRPRPSAGAGDYRNLQIKVILILPAKTTLRVNINASVQYCTMPIHWKRHLSWHSFILTLPLCRCESECWYTPDWNWNWLWNLLIIEISIQYLELCTTTSRSTAVWSNECYAFLNELALYCTLALILTRTVVFAGKIKITLICNFL